MAGTLAEKQKAPATNGDRGSARVLSTLYLDLVAEAITARDGMAKLHPSESCITFIATLISYSESKSVIRPTGGHWQAGHAPARAARYRPPTR